MEKRNLALVFGVLGVIALAGSGCVSGGAAEADTAAVGGSGSTSGGPVAVAHRSEDRRWR